MGMNAHISVGGDLLIAGVDGILPTSGALTKDAAALELAAITRSIKRMWRDEVIAKRAYPWTMCKWDEYGGMFITLPGGQPGSQRCLVVNTATGAFARFTGWDAQCFMLMTGNMYFGTLTVPVTTTGGLMLPPWSVAGRCSSRRRKPLRGARRGRRLQPPTASRFSRSCRRRRITW
jgi:hypothetical protein